MQSLVLQELGFRGSGSEATEDEKWKSSPRQTGQRGEPMSFSRKTVCLERQDLHTGNEVETGRQSWPSQNYKKGKVFGRA